MGASEDRATRYEQERALAASKVAEIMIPGYGIWTRDAIKALLMERDRAKAQFDHQSEEELSAHLREKHLGDPAFDNLHAPRAIRRQEERDRENDRWAY